MRIKRPVPLQTPTAKVRRKKRKGRIGSWEEERDETRKFERTGSNGREREEDPTRRREAHAGAKLDKGRRMRSACKRIGTASGRNSGGAWLVDGTDGGPVDTNSGFQARRNVAFCTRDARPCIEFVVHACTDSPCNATAHVLAVSIRSLLHRHSHAPRSPRMHLDRPILVILLPSPPSVRPVHPRTPPPSISFLPYRYVVPLLLCFREDLEPARHPAEAWRHFERRHRPSPCQWRHFAALSRTCAHAGGARARARMPRRHLDAHWAWQAAPKVRSNRNRKHTQ